MAKPLLLILMALTITTCFPATALSVTDQETRIIRMEEQVQGLKEQIGEIRNDVKAQLQGQNGNHVAVKELLSEVGHVSDEIKGLEARLGREMNKKADLNELQHSNDLNNEYEKRIDLKIGIQTYIIGWYGFFAFSIFTIICAYGGMAIKKVKDTAKKNQDEHKQQKLKWDEEFEVIHKREEQFQNSIEANALIPSGHLRFSNKEYIEAIEYYDKAIDLDPKNFTAWIYKGFSLANLSDFEKAIVAYDKAIELNPKDHVAWHNKGLSHKNLEEFKKALEAYDKAIELNPKNHLAWYDKAFSLGRLGKPKKALEAYNKAIEINPKDITPYMDIIEIQIIAKNYPAAMETIKTANKIPTETKNKIILDFLLAIAQKIEGQDTSVSENRLNTLLEQKPKTAWSFKEIEDWLKTVNLPEATKQYIEGLISRVKACCITE